MCGRFTLRSHPAGWCQQFLPQMDPAEAESIEWSPRYNIAPTQQILCAGQFADGPPQLMKLRWGLIPPWADDLSIGNRMINARGETAAEKASFKKPLARRRCLIPADGYFEWKKTAEGKQPYLFEIGDAKVFAFAGLWDQNRKASPDGATLRSCTVITTTANREASKYHDRMPVILEPDQYEQWLDPDFRDLEELSRLLAPARDDSLSATAVSRRVNSPKHDDTDCIEPVE